MVNLKKMVAGKTPRVLTFGATMLRNYHRRQRIKCFKLLRAVNKLEDAAATGGLSNRSNASQRISGDGASEAKAVLSELKKRGLHFQKKTDALTADDLQHNRDVIASLKMDLGLACKIHHVRVMHLNNYLGVQLRK